jgi:hypothetical protein
MTVFNQFLRVITLVMVSLSCLQGQGKKNDVSNQQPDWLIDDRPYVAKLVEDAESNEIILTNGLIQRVFRISPNGATVGFSNLITGETILRGVKPEAIVGLNGRKYEVGGLKGQPNYAYLREEWLETMHSHPAAMQFTSFEVSEPKAPFEWKRARYHAKESQWPPRGVHLRMNYNLPNTSVLVKEVNQGGIMVSVHYELYDGIPVIAKWISVKNNTGQEWVLDSFTSEIIAAVEYGSAVETREHGVQKPNIHVETDYAFSSFNVEDANHHAVRWLPDPEYHTQVNYMKLTPCLLEVGPEMGPATPIAPGGTFESFRTFVMPYDSYDRERSGLALRKMYRTLAPWTTENPLMMHARFADWDKVKTAIDQAADVGFEMIILTFGSGFDIEDDSKEYLEKMKSYAKYASDRGIEIGGYSLLASRKIGNGQDVVMPDGQAPTFGNSPCIGSDWGQKYFDKLYKFYQSTGFTLLEHDGSYPGDVCMSSDHPGHNGLEDSRWKQYTTISEFYQWCRGQGIYLNIPDYYYMTGGNKCGMGYREVNWSLPRAQQLIHTRQNIYDGAWEKTPSMGWMFVPLTEYHGGGAAATIEPLNQHLDHYQMMMVSNLGAGVQACYRGPRLFDTDQTRKMVSQTIAWYKEHREVLEGDVIHLRRADGSDLDYWLNVNPSGDEKGMLLVYNPLDRTVNKTIRVPLYFTGIKDKATVQVENQKPMVYDLDREYNIQLEIIVEKNHYTWVTIK